MFSLPEKNLRESRGKPAQVELYHMTEDIAESQELSKQHPEKVAQMTQELRELVQRGSSRPGANNRNDVHVRFDTIQEVRWAEELE